MIPAVMVAHLAVFSRNFILTFESLDPGFQWDENPSNLNSRGSTGVARRGLSISSSV